jgi:stress response protein SCP2
MVSVYRNKDEWKLATIAEVTQGRTVEELIDIARKHI